jgi:hypothetical protein
VRHSAVIDQMPLRCTRPTGVSAGACARRAASDTTTVAGKKGTA